MNYSRYYTKENDFVLFGYFLFYWQQYYWPNCNALDNNRVLYYNYTDKHLRSVHTCHRVFLYSGKEFY